MAVNGCQTNRLSHSTSLSVFHSVMEACSFKVITRTFHPRIHSEVPNPNFQIPGKVSISKSQKRKARDYPLFEIIDEKMRVSSRASLLKSHAQQSCFSPSPSRLTAKTADSLSLLFCKSSHASENLSCSEPHPLR